MQETIQKLKAAHDELMHITVSAQDAITFSGGIIGLRQAIAALERLAAQEQKEETE